MLCPHRPLRIPANFPHSLVWQVALGDVNPFYVTFECWSCRRHTTSDSRARKIENSLPQPPFPVKRWKPVTLQARKATGACARNVVGIVAQAVGGARHRVLDTAQIIADAPARTAVRLLCRAFAHSRAALVQGSNIGFIAVIIVRMGDDTVCIPCGIATFGAVAFKVVCVSPLKSQQVAVPFWVPKSGIRTRLVICMRCNIMLNNHKQPNREEHTIR